MFSESTQKQLLLIGGILGAVSGIIGSIGTIVGAFKNIAGLSPLASGVACAAIFLLGVWMLVKWRTRYSRLLKPDALRLERDNVEHLVGREDDVDILRGHCLIRQVVCLVGESGSGKSALVRAGLLPKLKNDKPIMPLLLGERWVDGWDTTPFVALKNALIESGAGGSDVTAKSADGQLLPGPRRLSALADVEQELTRLSNEERRTPIIIFDQFDDYQARNRERFLLNKTWLEPAALRQSNPFWDMVARLLEQDKLRCLFVTRSDTAVGLSSVEFLGTDRANVSIYRVPSPDIDGLLSRLTEGTPAAPVIADPDAGWTKLRERIIRDISEQNFILPQQLKIMLGGIQSLKGLNVKQYERVGGAAGIEAFYVEQHISRTARTAELEEGQVRAMLVALIDGSNPAKTWSLGKEGLLAAAAKVNGRPIADDKLDKALEELERGEMVRSLSDREGGRTVYRLDHDYLTRGVSAANRRANRWHYLLEDGAKAFQNAGTLWKKWKAFLPVATQCRLAWERARGRFRYGNRRSYALMSLIRFPVRLLFNPVVATLVGLGVFAVLISIYGIYGVSYTVDQERLNAFPTLVQSTTDTNQIDSLLGDFKTKQYSLKEEDRQSLAGRITETMLHSTNADQMNALVEAFTANARNLKPEEAQKLAASIPPKVQSATDTAQINALTRAFTAILPQLKPENARALADPIIVAIKGAGNPNERHALGLALAAIASELKPEETGPLDSTIVEAIKGTDGKRLTAPETALGDALNQGSKAPSQNAPAQESARRRTHSRH